MRSAPPQRIALDDGVRACSYGELQSRVTGEARWLASCGADRFALLADNGTPWAVADLSLHAGGFLSVPLPGYFTPEQWLHALDDAGVDGVLTDDAPRARDVLDGWRAAGEAPHSGLTLFRRPLEAAARPAAPPATCKVTYTSGSTARPKGVCLAAAQEEAVAASLAAATAVLDIGRHLCLLPLPTLLENLAGLYAPLLAGATCIVPPSSVTGMSYAGPDVPRLLAAIAAARPESLILVPELLHLLVLAVERGWHAPPSLKFIAVGVASSSPALLERAAAGGLPVFEGYGLSECASVVCLNTPGARRVGSVGRPLPHARVRLADDGGIVVSGVTMLGYLGDEPRVAGSELATGDVGEFDEDGYCYVRGRLRNVFIGSYGRNVSPEWVEREIAQRGGLRHVLVHGEARPYPVALVSAASREMDASAIERAIEAANAGLPGYAQVRRWIRAPEPFTRDNGLLTSNGRLRRDAILARHGALIESLYGEELAS